MDRNTALYAVVALLGVLAVALAAAALPSAVEPAGGPGPQGPGDGDGGFVTTPPPESPGAAVEVPFLSELLTLVALAAAVVSLLYLYHNRRELAGMVVGAAVLVVGAYLFFRYFSVVLPTGSPPDPPEFGDAPSMGGGGGGGSVATADPSTPSVLVVLLLAVALAGVGLALARWVRRPAAPDADTADEDARTDAAAVGRAAGRAADRLEDTSDVDNEVYRAWAEMTELLDLPRPDTKTPGEFASAAVDAGMAPEDVRELTRLFEAVRYGDHRPSSADERRALAVFRRIEETYAGDER